MQVSLDVQYETMIKFLVTPAAYTHPNTGKHEDSEQMREKKKTDQYRNRAV